MNNLLLLVDRIHLQVELLDQSKQMVLRAPDVGAAQVHPARLVLAHGVGAAADAIACLEHQHIDAVVVKPFRSTQT